MVISQRRMHLLVDFPIINSVNTGNLESANFGKEVEERVSKVF